MCVEFELISFTKVVGQYSNTLVLLNLVSINPATQPIPLSSGKNWTCSDSIAQLEFLFLQGVCPCSEILKIIF